MKLESVYVVLRPLRKKSNLLDIMSHLTIKEFIILSKRLNLANLIGVYTNLKDAEKAALKTLKENS